MEVIIYTLGWCGSVAYLISYAYRALSPKSHDGLYYSANAFAAVLVLAISFYTRTVPTIAINLFWLAISVRALAMGDQISGHYLKAFLGPIRVIMGCGILVGLAWLLVALETGSDVLAYAGAVAFCMSYMLYGERSIGLREFSFWNMIGALALLPQLWILANTPVFFLEVVWSLIALYAVIHSPRLPDPPPPGP